MVGDALRAAGHEVFDNWYAAGPIADDHWREYEIGRGHSYREALASPEAEHNFSFDKKWLDWADTGVLVLPAGKSAHMELIEVQKHGEAHVLFDEEPKDRYDLMYKLADAIHFSIEELVKALGTPDQVLNIGMPTEWPVIPALPPHLKPIKPWEFT